jgi:hypothetical protein
MAKDMRRALSMLTILLATCQTTLHTLQAANNPVDEELTDLLEKMVERTRLEIETLRGDV